MKTVTGWQPDGSYVPCPECKWEPPPEPEGCPGVAIHFPGTVHRMECSTVPKLSPLEERELHERLVEMDRCRRRGWAEAQGYVIG